MHSKRLFFRCNLIIINGSQWLHIHSTSVGTNSCMSSHVCEVKIYLNFPTGNKIELKHYIQSFQTLPNEYLVPTVDQDTCNEA